MENQIEQLVQQFESGRITRRQLVKHISAFAAMTAGVSAGAQTAETPTSTFKATGLNHIALRVPDVARSRDFYVKHLGLMVARDSDSSCFLNFGGNFLALFKGDEPGMDHYCYAIENYEVAEAVDTLNDHDLSPRREDNRVYFKDPDGLTVQLSAQDHTP